MESFDKVVQYILEDQSKEEEYTLIKPIDYSEMMLISSFNYRDNIKHCLFYKVLNDKERNNEYIKDEFLPEIPKEIANNWTRKKVIQGKNVNLLKKRLYDESLYIINTTDLGWQIRDMDIFETYLKPTGIGSDVKDVFGDVYEEI